MRIRKDMGAACMARHEMKTQMGASVSLLMIGVIFLFSYVINDHFESQLKQLISKQQFSMITEICDSIDANLQESQQALLAEAPLFLSLDMENPTQAQRLLDTRPALHAIFDNGLFLFSRDGRIIVESPYLPNRRGRDIAFREYYKKTVATMKPQISDPYISTHNPGKPAVILTAPLIDSKGRLLAILAGSLDLTKDNFLGKLSRVKIGDTGYLYLYNSSRTIIMHPDQRRLLKKDMAPGINRAFDKGIEGFEGTEESVNSKGINSLTSVRHLKSTDWILAANFPAKEAYAPIVKAKHYANIAAFSGAGLSVLIVWVLMHFQMAPLSRFTDRIRNLSMNDGMLEQVPDSSSGEISALGSAFNEMVIRLGTEHCALQEAIVNLEDEKAKTQAIIAAMGVGLTIMDTDFRVTYQNQQGISLMGSHVGKLCHQAFENQDRVCDGCPMALAFEDGLIHSSVRSVSPFGQQLFTEITASPLRNASGKIIAGIEVVRDITEKRRMEETIEHLAFHDTLTGLPNRHLFHDHLRQAIAFAARNNQLLAVMFIDLDCFKSVNDELGHAIGDQLLQGVAKRLRACCCRSGDTIARYGGDEFLIILSDLQNSENAAVVARHVVEELARGFVLSEHAVHTSVSIGISLYPQDGQDSESLVRNADLAMYEAKDKGRNDFRFYSPSAEAQAEVQAETQVDTKADTKADTKVDTKVDTKADTKADAQVGAVLPKESHPHPDPPLEGEGGLTADA
jgi:diguanylate cyclase (GGDEF)-like protein